MDILVNEERLTYYLIMESRQFHGQEVIGKNAHVSGIYFCFAVDYITFWRGLLFYYPDRAVESLMVVIIQ